MAKNWVFTFNNYTIQDEEKVKDMDVQFMIFGHEIAPTTGTKHLQGYFQFKTKKRMEYIKKRLGDKIHLEKAYG